MFPLAIVSYIVSGLNLICLQAMVASGDEGGDKSQWPPELAALERQFTAKYQHKLAELVEEHALELADMRAEYEVKLGQLVKEQSVSQHWTMFCNETVISYPWGNLG